MSEITETTEAIENTEPIETQKMQESFQIQKSQWIKEQTEAKRKQEDQLLEQMKQEQLLLQSMDTDINANMEHAKEGRRYREEIHARIEKQVYEMHNLSQDKLEGIREYGNAYHRGFSLAMFLLAVALTVFAGYLNGFGSDIFLAMLAMTAMQSAVLVHNERGIWLFRVFCKLVSLLLFPAMLVVFLFYELKYPEYHVITVYGSYILLILLVLFTLVYFIYDPYREAKSRIGEAKDTMRNLDRQAKKLVKKNQKNREKEAIQQEKLHQREQVKEERIQEKAQRHIERMRKMEELKERFFDKFRKSESENMGEQDISEVSSNIATADADTKEVIQGNELPN